VVVDSFLTDTARCADLVLPTTTLLETDDVQAAYGHHWIGVARPVAAPLHDVRSDLEIAQALAARLGLDDVVAGDARTWQQRVLAPGLAAHGVDVARLERGAVRNPLVPRVLFADRRFATASGRVNLIHEEPPDHPRDPGFPLLLLALSTDASQSSQWARHVEGPLPATVHPDAAAGVPDGATCRIESAIGSMPVRLRHDRRQRRDVVIVPKGGHLAHDQCANAIIRAALTDIGEGGALYDEPVRIVPDAP
jgi:anaerobic selenocysteine-containing dehydrogenase